RGLAPWVHRRAGALFLPHRLRQPVGCAARFRCRQRACGADLPVHRHRRRHADLPHAAPGDRAVSALARPAPGNRSTTWTLDALIQIVLIANTLVMLAPIVIMVFS